MRRDELKKELQQPYTGERGFGVTHIAKAGYENIWFVVPPPPPTELPPGLRSTSIGKANAILQQRPPLAEAPASDRIAAYLFARREAVSSSRMEGTWSTVDNVLTPAEAYDEGEVRSDNLSVKGYAAALEHGVAQIAASGLSALTTKLICSLHRLVMSKDPHFSGVAGRLRTPGMAGDVVQIGAIGRKEDAIYNPAPPEHVAPCLERLMGWMRDPILIELGDAGMGMALPIRMAIAHSHFEAIHPFSDGNGRVGRMLWPLQMAAAGRLPLYLSGYVEANRRSYGDALQDAQKRLSYASIVEFVAEAVIASHEDETLSKAAIGSLPGAWRKRGAFRKGSSAERALSVLTRMPIITARTLSEELGVSFQAASNALKALESRHIIRERTGYERNRLFAVEEVIAVLARKFAEDPEIALESARHALGMARLR